jgi:general secretion pathway protein K
VTWRAGDTDRQAGFALVAVLWFLVLVAAFVAPFAVAARTDFLIASNRSKKVRLDTLAEGVSTLLSLRLMEHGDAAAPLADILQDSSPVSCNLGAYTFDIRLQDQSGLIDLNAADRALLATGLRAIGVATADAVAEAVVNYRHSGAPVPGADVGIEGGAKGGPFETVVELSDFEALKYVEPTKLHRVFTVHSGQGIVALARAPAELARLLKTFRGTQEADAGGSSRALAVEVTVSQPSAGVKGYSGYLIQPSDPPHAPFRRVEPLFEPSLDPGSDRPAASCPASLRKDIAALLVGNIQ